MEWTPDDRADAYLDGSLSRDEARAFERDLAEKPEVARALNSALVLREMLQSMPPTSPPEGLEERIAGALALVGESSDREASALLPRVRAALSGFSWSVRGPAMALGSLGNAEPVAAGLTQARWILGPLGAPREAKPKPPSKPIWQRALAYAWSKV